MCRDLGAKRGKKVIVYNGYRVFEPVYPKNQIVGFPVFILQKEKEIRYSNPDECLAILDKLNP